MWSDTSTGINSVLYCLACCYRLFIIIRGRLFHKHLKCPQCHFKRSRFRGGCSSAGRAGRLVIGRSLVHIPAPGWAELHVEVSLSKILSPKLLPMCSWHLVWRPLPSARALRCWRLVQGAPCPRPETAEIGSSKKNQRLHKRDKAVTDNGWMEI